MTYLQIPYHSKTKTHQLYNKDLLHRHKPPTGDSYKTILTGECESYVVEQEPGTRNQLLDGLTFTMLTHYKKLST